MIAPPDLARRPWCSRTAEARTRLGRRAIACHQYGTGGTRSPRYFRLHGAIAATHRTHGHPAAPATFQAVLGRRAIPLDRSATLARTSRLAYAQTRPTGRAA